MGSGLVCNEDLIWIAFHGSFDFGYLYKVVTNQLLPEKGDHFFEILKLYFPNIYDIKYITKDVEELTGGLSKMSSYMGVNTLIYQIFIKLGGKSRS